MRSLIINADDVGFSEAINEAVRECYLKGSITGASIMACGPRFSEAAGMLRGIGREEVGAHLTLTGMKRFAHDYKDFVLKYLLRKIKPKQVHAELSSQIKRVRDEGLRITHLDSHEHVHMFPAVLNIVIKLALEFNVPYIRLPLESPRVAAKSFSVKDVARHFSLAAFASSGKNRIARNNLRHNDHFLGHFHSGRVDHDIFRFMIDNLSEGVTELAVHPSVDSAAFYKEFPWYKNTKKEFDLLTGEDWKKDLADADIRLVTHKKIAEV